MTTRGSITPSYAIPLPNERENRVGTPLRPDVEVDASGGPVKIVPSPGIPPISDDPKLPPGQNPVLRPIDYPDWDLSERTPVVHKLAGFTAEPSVLVNGYPTVPRFWCRARTLASLEGVAYQQSRPNPTEVFMAAHTRFLAHNYDNQSGVWRPYITSGSDYFFRSPPGLSPYLNEITYRIRKELFTVQALRFDPGDYLISSFNQGRDDAHEYSIVMVMIPDVPLEYTVLSTQNSEGEIAVNLSGTYNLKYGGKTSRLSLRTPATAITPTYLVFSTDGSSATCYVASNARNIYSMKITQRMVDPYDLNFTLGKTHKGKATATMNLMELHLYNYAITTTTETSVGDVIGALSGIYGGQ